MNRMKEVDQEVGIYMILYAHYMLKLENELHSQSVQLLMRGTEYKEVSIS